MIIAILETLMVILGTCQVVVLVEELEAKEVNDTRWVKECLPGLDKERAVSGKKNL